jgi:hypothetical protein
MPPIIRESGELYSTQDNKTPFLLFVQSFSKEIIGESGELY